MSLGIWGNLSFVILMLIFSFAVIRKTRKRNGTIAKQALQMAGDGPLP